MASTTPTNREILSTSRVMWNTDLHYVPSETKLTPIWMAQAIYYAKRNSVQFLEGNKARKYRSRDGLELEEQLYKLMFDPKTPSDSGGKAAYVSSSWKANPVYIHLMNIVTADLQQLPNSLECTLSDNLAKTRRQRDNDRIIYRDALREQINYHLKLLGVAEISKSQDPFKWVKNFKAQVAKEQQAEEQSEGEPQGQQEETDTISNYKDLIRSQITEPEDFAIYNELIYKCDLEMGLEKGIQHYLVDQNKWQDRHSEDFIDDLRHFNRAAGEMYTDQITGRPVIERFPCERLFTAPFKLRDGSDITHYFIEYEITFANFVRTIGKDLSPAQLKDVFIWNKTHNAIHAVDWTEEPTLARDNSKILIGKFAILSQDYDVFMDNQKPTDPTYTKTDYLYEPHPNNPSEYRDERHYNVWYQCYYLPPTTEHLGQADYQWQAKFVFGIQKNMDQFRDGEDGRYTTSPLVVYYSTKASFTDIVEYWMPKINYASMQFENCLVNDIDATVMAQEFLGGLMRAVDEDNGIKTPMETGSRPVEQGGRKEPTGGSGVANAALEQWKMIKQAGSGFMKFTDSNGALIADPGKLFVRFQNGLLAKGEKFLALIALMYNELTKALAYSDVTEGQDAKPRTPVAGIEASIASSNKGRWFIQKGYSTFYIMFGERIVRYILEYFQEKEKYGYTKRYDEFVSSVGKAFGLEVEGLKDIPPETIGLTVNFVDNTGKKELVRQLALEYVNNKELDDDFVYLLLSEENWKVGYFMVRIGVKKRRKEAQIEQERSHQMAMEEKDKDLQIAQTQLQLQGQIKNNNIQTQAQAQYQTQSALNQQKHQGQLELTAERTQNKMVEQSQKNQLEKDKEAQAPAEIVGQ